MFGELHFDYGVLASVVAAGVSTTGLLSMVILGDWGRRNSTYFSAFAIGVLTTAVGFHVIPEALAYSPHAWKAVLAGFALMILVGGALRFSHNGKANNQRAAFGYASIIALGAHSFLDGVLYESSFHNHLFTGWISTVGLLLHEFPEGVIAFFLLRETGMGAALSSFWAFVAASLTTVAGAVFASGFTSVMPVSTLLGLTAGGLIYIIAFHLGPHAKLTPNHRGYAIAGLGVIVATAAIILRSIQGH